MTVMGDATHHNQWARLSVNFWTDPKVLACDHVARSVFVASIAVAGQHLSDGVVHRHTMRLYAGDDGTLEDAAGQLVGVGLWEPVGDGMSWRICSYLKWNDSRADVRRARIKRLLGGVAGRHKRYHKAEKDSQCPFCVTGCSTVEQLMRHEQF